MIARPFPCAGAAMKLVATPGGPLRGEAAIPGDKSCSHRALILGAMAEGTTRISGLLESEDVLATARAVAALGATVERVGAGRMARHRRAVALARRRRSIAAIAAPRRGCCSAPVPGSTGWW